MDDFDMMQEDRISGFNGFTDESLEECEDEDEEEFIEFCRRDEDED